MLYLLCCKRVVVVLAGIVWASIYPLPLRFGINLVTDVAPTLLSPWTRRA